MGLISRKRTELPGWAVDELGENLVASGDLFRKSEA